MRNKKFDIFISYRRIGGFETAKHLYDLLTNDGYTVSFDIDTLRSGEFPKALLKRVDQCKDFILILNPTALDRCMDETFDKKNDWLRNELAYAIQTEKNIIPIFASDFAFPENLPEDILKLQFINGVHYNEQYFDAMYGRLKEFLKSRPVHKIRRYLLLSALVTCLAGILGYSLFHPRIGGNAADLSGQVLISARLLDSVFVRTDPAIAKVIDYDSYMGIDREYGFGPFYDEFHYVDTLINGVYAIRPHGRYVGDYYQHDSITIIDDGFLMIGEDYFTNLHYPVLDVSLVNNSSQTILVDELLIEVEESHADNHPFVIIRESGGHLTLEDRGWNPWESASLRFTLLPEGQSFDGDYRFEVPILSTDIDPETPGCIDIPLYDYFVQSGIDFDRLCACSIVTRQEKKEIPFWDNFTDDAKSLDSLKTLLSPVRLTTGLYDQVDGETGETRTYSYYEDPYLMLYGELTFDDGSTYKVGGHVRFLTSEGWGAEIAYCSRVFDVKLKTNGQNYRIKYPVSHYLKAGDVDRIAIQIDADQTSWHTLRVRLHNVNQIDIQTDPIDLLIFKYSFKDFSYPEEDE